MAELDLRKQHLLRAVILEYVQAAEPVGSEMLVQKYEFGVRSATVRNELAEMSELGFLEQPHTSAGRIPSDLGYRYYVDRLITSKEVSDPAKDRVKHAANDGDALQGLLKDVTRVLSRLTQLLAVGTTIRDANTLIKTAIVSALGPNQAMLVLVLSNGHVENRMLECPPGITLQDVGSLNEHLAANAVGKSLSTLSKSKPPTAIPKSGGDKLVGLVWSEIRTICRNLMRGMMVLEGEEYILSQPEFRQDVSTVTELLQQLVDSDVLYQSISSADGLPQSVTIGKEHRHAEMQSLSVVRNAFYAGGNEAGIIAIVGPTRMDYDGDIPLLNFTAKALSDSLSRFFG
jgi:heat-inducible transcriptional repressor